MDDTAWSDVSEMPAVVPETPPEALLPAPPAEEPPEALLPAPPHEVPLRPPDFPWPHQGVGRVDALLIASQMAYGNFFAAVEHARAQGQTQVALHDPKVYRVGKHSFHWSTFVHGLRTKGRRRRDRTHWTDRGLLVPFEHLRRALAQGGVYVVLFNAPQPVCRVFDHAQIRQDPDFTVIDVNGAPQYVYKHDPARRNFYNIVPF